METERLITREKKKEKKDKSRRKENKKTRQYYRELEELEALYEADDYIINGKHAIIADNTSEGDNILSKIVFVANIGLLFAKAAAAYLTSGTSLSIISTLLDSIVDLGSSFGIWLASNAIMNTDAFLYPRGRKNLELIAFIFIGTIMGMANIYIMFQSVNRLVFQMIEVQMTLFALGILVATIITKSVLLFLCYRQDSSSSRVLAIDQRNDIYTNIVSLIGAGVASVWTPYADPIAAFFIAAYISYTWVSLVLEQLPKLSGKKCTSQEYSRIARVIIKHSHHIKCVETLLVYHTGEKCRVEAHVVLDPMLPAKIVHDEVEEPLKRKLERLPFVERAFVHPDYECDGYEK